MPDLPEDDQLVRLLDDYLEQLQAGQQPDREAILRQHPELQSALDCLDALEGMASSAISSGEMKPEFPSSITRLPCDFGSYELIEEIGRGGMGVVYKARQKSLDRLVAVKMILASHLASEEHVRRFQVEARAAARLRHSNIVHIHEVGQVHGQHFFAMEFIDGVSLAQRLAQGPIEQPTAARLVCQVARAVAHLHREGVVHRDLKPSNILIDSEGQPYVTDFGLAKFFSGSGDPTATGVIAGTPSYMAPEQAAGHGSQVGPASDVYSLGAILYELLTGRPVFREETPLDTLMQVLTGEPIPPRKVNAKIPRPLELIVLKALARAPEDRYSSADALADDLERFLRGEAIRARPPHLVQRIWTWSRREPALATRLAALGVFYLVGLANYSLGLVDVEFHRNISILTCIWATCSVILQQTLKFQRWSLYAQFLWGTLDAALLLAVLLKVADGAASSLIVGYPLLIVASGLWFRVRFVWYMTALSLLSYGVLVWDFYDRRPELQQGFPATYDRHVIFAISLVVLASVVAYLVQRVRMLSSYYGEKL
jgi:serine/threonine-protein kinase